MPGACSKADPAKGQAAASRLTPITAPGETVQQGSARQRETPARRRARFKTLAEPIYSQIYQSAVRISRNPDLAADLTQETMLRAFEKFHQFRDGTNFRAWVMRILVNNYINRYRKVKRTPDEVTWDDVTVGEERDLSERSVSPIGVEDKVIQGISASIVRRAVDALPEPFRTAVILSDLQGLSYDEVKDVLSVPLGTVRSRIFRGRKLLVATLAPYRNTGAI